MKAIAGCSTDEIKGVQRVGEKTAAKFIRGELKTTSAAYQNIILGNKIWKRNIPLVQLPYHGTDQFPLEVDDVNIQSWRHLAKKLGMKSLMEVENKPKRKGFGLTNG